MNDLTILYYTSNRAPVDFTRKIRARLYESASELDLPIISVSQAPLSFGVNICLGDIGASTLNLYRQILIAAQAATTEYVVCCEDDCLYLPSHFTCHRPPPDTFSYNQNKWTVLAWDRLPIMSNKKHRCVMNQCIAPRQLLIDALSERFDHLSRGLIPPEQVRMHFAEPGRYEKWYGVTIRNKEEYWSPEPSIVFCHLYALDHLGDRKRHGDIRTESCIPWGSAKDLIMEYVGYDEWRRQRGRDGPVPTNTGGIVTESL